MGRKHILHFPLPTRITRLVLSGLALFAQEFVNVALRWHGTFLHRSRDIHHLLLMLLLLLLLRLRLRVRLVMRHGCMVIAVHTWLLLLKRRLLLLLNIRRVLVMQRRVQKIVATHGGDGAARQGAYFQLMVAMADGAARLSGCRGR
jgi:hypothetical protein